MGKTVIVTGAFGALGQAVVSELNGCGWTVVGVDLVSEPANSMADLAIGGIDFADGDAVAKCFAEVAQRFGSIEGLVNIAGGFVWELMEGGSLANWDDMYRKNLRTAAVSCRAVLAHLPSKGGVIVNIGAAAAVKAGAGMAPYAASKAGVRVLTESLADELRARGARVNAVLPTILDTPANRRDMPDADPSEWVKVGAAAKVIAFLLSADAAPITGAAIPLSLGS